MSHGHTRIDSKGACIYCHRSEVELTDEHIVPLSLGGQHVIRDASCHDCADITKKFEQDVARELWGDARTSYDAPSRRKKKRSTHVVLDDPSDRSRKLRVPFSEYPAPMVFYLMGRAGILLGLPNTVDVSKSWKLITVADEAKLKKFEKKYPGKLTGKFRHVPDSFARLIAKIGYGQALCSLDPGDFRPICLPYILGTRKNPSFVVGGQLNIAEPDPEMGYVLGSGGFGNLSRLMIISEVRLIANNHTPTYHVVVGDVTGRENVETVIRKLGVSDVVMLSTGASPEESSEELHWMPQVWPLPFWNS